VFVTRLHVSIFEISTFFVLPVFIVYAKLKVSTPFPICRPCSIYTYVEGVPKTSVAWETSTVWQNTENCK
jgi:hypothetical protein